MDNIVYSGVDYKDNWFKNKYFTDGSNGRYFTFQVALNLINQRFVNPLIVETGCQRQEDDIGAGMSSSIFAEYIYNYGGKLYVVDNNKIHLTRAMSYLKKWSNITVNFFLRDSVAYLHNLKESPSLLYLDSYDYPIFEMWQTMFPGNTDRGRELLEQLTREELFDKFGHLINPCQEHCLKEFQAIEDQLTDDSVVLIDDNDFSGGGKPGTLKPYLEEKGWVCLLDSQQTLWIRR